MTNREKINYLRKYKRLDDYVNQLLQDSDALRAKAEKVTATITGMPHGNGGENATEEAICKLIDLSYEINAKIDQYVDLGRKIRAEIDAIPDETLRLILLYRYIDGKHWEQIAVDLGYSWRQTHRLHRKVLEEFKIT